MPPSYESYLVRVYSNNAIPYFRRNMRTFNISFLAVLSCIAMIGATPIENRSPHSPAEARDMYVASQQLMEVST